MATLEIPLSAAPQTFEITLGDIAYRLTVVWRDAEEGGWTLDVATPQGAPVLQGVPLVVGVDMLGQYEYLGFGGSLVVLVDNRPGADPTYEDLGSLSHLYFVTS